MVNIARNDEIKKIYDRLKVIIDNGPGVAFSNVGSFIVGTTFRRADFEDVSSKSQLIADIASIGWHIEANADYFDTERGKAEAIKIKEILKQKLAQLEEELKTGDLTSYDERLGDWADNYTSEWLKKDKV